MERALVNKLSFSSSSQNAIKKGIVALETVVAEILKWFSERGYFNLFLD